MSPSKESNAESSGSRDLILFGSRHVQTRNGIRSIRNEDGQLPSTARALVLRNGKYGAMGTGEIVPTKHISGREKLDLLGGMLYFMSFTDNVVSWRTS
jgi:hypothetical protein